MQTRPFILCVDDEHIIIDSLSNQLRNYFGDSVEIEVANSGMEALEVIEDFVLENGCAPNLVISDQIMPQMKGDELLSIINKRHPETVKVLLTGQADKDDVVKAINKGDLFKYIEKPWDFEELIEIIEQAFKRYATHKKSSKELDKLVTLSVQLEKEIREKNEDVFRKKKEIESRDREVEASLRYMKQLQKTTMPQSNDLKKIFTESFLLHKPLGDLGGDFYWIQEYRGLIFACVADCTGHGIEGGLMTMVVNNALNTIVLKENISNPSDILCALQSQLKEVISQGGILASMDGVRISICVINKQKKELMFSGARNNLTYIEKNKLITVKGDRDIIGGTNKHVGSYLTHIVDIKPNMSFYMFSDGLVDQLGGEDFRKYSIVRLYRMLEINCDEALQTQHKEILFDFETWRGDTPQVDDVLLVGFKL